MARRQLASPLPTAHPLRLPASVTRVRPRQSMNFAATFEECDIRPKSPLKNKQMRDNIFLRCNFRGHYIGCDFGSWLEGSKGRAEDCDFSGCRLHLTRFFNSELSRLKLPGWPHVYLIGDSNGTWVTEWEKASAMLPLRLASLHKLGDQQNPRCRNGGAATATLSMSTAPPGSRSLVGSGSLWQDSVMRLFSSTLTFAEPRKWHQKRSVAPLQSGRRLHQLSSLGLER